MTVAHSAAEAWNLCKSDQVTFDLIIADGDSPTMGGIDLVTKLRSVRYSAAIVVFLARMDDDLVRGYQGLGTKRILKKPLKLSELREFRVTIGCVGFGNQGRVKIGHRLGGCSRANSDERKRRERDGRGSEGGFNQSFHMLKTRSAMLEG